MQSNAFKSGEEVKVNVSSFSIILVFVCISFAGFCLIPFLQVKLSPSHGYQRISVQFNWQGTPPRIVEQEVTSKLEGIFSSIKGLHKISSVSGDGYGRINLEFKKEVNIATTRFEVATLISHVYQSLPELVSYPELSVGDHTDVPPAILTYTLNGNANPGAIQQFARENIAPVLGGIEGVEEVNVYGGSTRQWRIELNTTALRSLGLQGGDIARAISNSYLKGFIGKGSYKDDARDYENEVMIVFQTDRSDSLRWKNIPVSVVGGRIIYLEEVAKIRHEEQVPLHYYRVNGLNTVHIQIIPEAEANAIGVASRVKDWMVNQSMPPGYSLILAADATEYLNHEITSLAFRAVCSLAIVLFVILAFSRRFRFALLALASMTISLSLASILYHVLKVELHWYSLAGVAISFSLMAHNIILVTYYYIRTRSTKIFFIMLGSTLCVIGAMSAGCLLNEEQQLNLKDLAIVISVNLVVSLCVSVFFIPACLERFNMVRYYDRVFSVKNRKVVKTLLLYKRFILFLGRNKWIFISVLILSFGVPIHLLPIKVKETSRFSTLYNETLGNRTFVRYVRPYMEKSLGGVLRLFAQNDERHDVYREGSRTLLHVSTKMPYGSTAAQHNEVMNLLENYVSKYKEVELFEISIHNYAHGSMLIRFKPEFERGNFPFRLKQELEKLVTSIGSIEASVYGVGLGFSNDLDIDVRNNRIILEGYNYEQLYHFAQLLSNSLSEHSRIKNIAITGAGTWRENDREEFYMHFNERQLALNYASPRDFFYGLTASTFRVPLSPVYIDNELHPVVVSGDVADKFNLWELQNDLISVHGTQYRVSQVGKIEKMQIASEVYRFDQQYHLVVAYNFIGDVELANIVARKQVEIINSGLPIGYKASLPVQDWWNTEEKTQYLLIALIVVVIYFIGSILFESLLLPLSIIAILPVSFIGVFLTYYFLDLTFSHGAFCAAVLICGVVVGPTLYVINDFNNYKRSLAHKSKHSVYIRAINDTIIPITLTLFLSIVCMIPYLNDQTEYFWFTFSWGIIGGIGFAWIGLIIYLPIFLNLSHRK